MLKMIIVLVGVVSLVLAEPPVGDGYEQAHRQYLPPDLTVARAAKSSYDELSHQYSETVNEIPHEYGTPSFRSDVSQEYGAPFVRNSPSSAYGTPNARGSISEEYNPSARFSPERSDISQVYGAPSLRNSPSESYGPPDQRSISQQYGAPDARSTSDYAVQSRNSLNRYPSPVQKYGVPRFSKSPVAQYSQPSSNQYSNSDGVKSFGLQRQSQFNTHNNLPQTYGAPARSLPSQYGAPEARNVDSYQQGFGQSLSNTYGAPKAAAPAKQYGVPESRAAEEHTNALVSSYSAGRSSQAPGYDAAPRTDASRSGYAYSRNALEELLNQEPASYEFGYKVSDYTSGSDFGHAESRQAERAEGSYFVVLPDGTKQVVEYEADERGFKPRISVEAAESGPY